MSHVISRPDSSAVHEFYRGYLNELEGDDLLQMMRAGSIRLRELCRELGEERVGHRYAEGKWTVGQLLNHLADSERVFAYRALSFARGESQELPGFSENDYAAQSRADGRSLASFVEELEQVRGATLSLYSNLEDDVLDRQGTANGVAMSVRAIGYVIAGHEVHHTAVLRERYL